MIATKKELENLINVPFNTYRKWRDDKLEKELLKNCWRLVYVEKQGRSIVYNLEYEEQDFNVIDYVEGEFKVKDGEDFMKHTSARVKNIKEDRPTTAREISEATGIGRATSYRYDKKLEEKGVIQKSNDCYYLVKNKKTGEVAITTKEAYMNFWSVNKAVKKELSDLYKRLEGGEIAPKDYDFLTDAVKDKMQSDYYYYEVSKWIIDESNTTYQVIKEFLI